MILDRESWQTKYELVKGTWRACRPRERIKGTRVTSRDFHFSTTRSLPDGTEARVGASGLQLGNGEWSIDARIAIRDRTVEKLRSEVVTTFDSSGLSTLDFDVLAAAAVIEGRERGPSPQLGLNSSDDEVRLQVKELADKIDEIWNFAGGFALASLKTLSIWALRNWNLAGVHLNVGEICTAIVHDEPELAGEILREYEVQCEQARRSWPVNETTQTIAATQATEFAKLRSLLLRH